MKSIKTKITSGKSITIPGSKSVSHRMLICASMADGTSLIRNILKSDDINHTMSALSRMGADIQEQRNESINDESLNKGDHLNEDDSIQDGTIRVTGFSGRPKPCDDEIYLGNSGTSMRLLAGTAALGTTPYILTGDHRMQERPMGDLLNALIMAGADATSKSGNGTPPVIIKGGNLKHDNTIGGTITLDCSQSSQYLSAMLMMGAVLPEGLLVHLPGPTVSAPYVDLTIDIMRKFGVNAERMDDRTYRVAGKQTYRAGNFAVEPDLSNASYFWAAGAVTGHMVTVTDINKDSLQGDKRLLEIFRQMGCQIEYGANSIGVRGFPALTAVNGSTDSGHAQQSYAKGSISSHDNCLSSHGKCLNAVEVDMSDIPDVVPTLAVVAAFAKGTTKIVNIEHLREKECDRISVVVSQLRKIGVDASEGKDWLSVTGLYTDCNDTTGSHCVKGFADNKHLHDKQHNGSGGRIYHGAFIETFNDHRMAMAFSIAGLRVDGIEIENEGCVAKSFPNYWEKFDSLGV
ncbi:MAG: 3-phosphoshikimate 1-carboxyvinyltransferase [Desulfamplus sp.]|nr:3-phosphoshikimate 1-carboxyvinyltransferase [Desulfamplus sp.]